MGLPKREYDGLQQLIRMDRSNGVTQAWDLESAGNWATFTDGTNVQTRTHNTANEMTAIGGATNTLAHDPAGNMVKIPVADAEALRYQDAMYDAWNQLTQVSTGGVTIARYSYDGAQRRIRKATPASTNDFYYDGWLLIQETQSGTGVSPVTNTYVWGLDLSASLQGAGGIGGLLSVVCPPSSVLWYVHDGNGNVTKLLTSTGTVNAAYVYDPYGGTISMSGPASTNNVFRFSSKYLDQETGLYYYGYRFYSPGLGRWISRDPLHEESFYNQHRKGKTIDEQRRLLEDRKKPVYAFVHNEPIATLDPHGLRCVIRICVGHYSTFVEPSLVNHLIPKPDVCEYWGPLTCSEEFIHELAEATWGGDWWMMPGPWPWDQTSSAYCLQSERITAGDPVGSWSIEEELDNLEASYKKVVGILCATGKQCCNCKEIKRYTVCDSTKTKSASAGPSSGGSGWGEDCMNKLLTIGKIPKNPCGQVVDQKCDDTAKLFYD